VAHEAVVNYREPTQPNPGYNEADVVRSARPEGKNVDYNNEDHENGTIRMVYGRIK
jgi:hypothetical protein